MKFDIGLMVENPADGAQRAKELEEMGYDGVQTFEGAHDPFLPLASASSSTQRIELTTAIAVAFARNPMLLANLGYDLNLMSRGRFIMGLGSQIRPHIEKRYSMPWSKPAARMRELVLAVRAIWRNWESGEPLAFNGEFYTHTLMTPIFSPGKHPYGLPRIFVAGVGPIMTRVAGEVGDGFLVHPLHTPDFLRDQTLPAIEDGLARAERARSDFEIACQVIVVSGKNSEEMELAKQMARGQISFYASTPAYRPALEQHGWGDLQPEMNALSKAGKWEEMANLISDEILHAFAVIGSPKEIAERLLSEHGALSDRLTPVTYSRDPTQLKALIDALRKERDG